jgi:hypothetical protein
MTQMLRKFAQVLFAIPAEVTTATGDERIHRDFRRRQVMRLILVVPPRLFPRIHGLEMMLGGFGTSRPNVCFAKDFPQKNTHITPQMHTGVPEQ